MARQRTSRITESRVGLVMLGVLLGVAWGVVMWLITGADGGGRAGTYLAVTMGMFGGGIAAIFGAVQARKRGESIGPRRTKD